MADQQVTFDVDFTPHTEYEPYSGEGASDRIPFDGYFKVNVASYKPYMTKAKDGQPPKPSIKVGAVIQDDDAKGMKLIDDVLCGGKDKNGEDLSRQLMEFLHSTGTPKDSIRQNAANKTKANIDAVMAKVVGRTAYCEVQADTYDGKETSRVINWITEERYNQAKTVGAHRRSRRATGATQGGGAGFQNLGGTPNGAAAGTSTPAGGNSLPML